MENCNYLTQKVLHVYIFRKGFSKIGPIFSKIILNEHSRFQVYAKSGMRKIPMISDLYLHQR